jgi:hypothetical protein
MLPDAQAKKKLLLWDSRSWVSGRHDLVVGLPKPYIGSGILLDRIRSRKGKGVFSCVRECFYILYSTPRECPVYSHPFCLLPPPPKKKLLLAPLPLPPDASQFEVQDGPKEREGNVG